MSFDDHKPWASPRPTITNLQAERAARGGSAKLSTLLELSIKNAQGDQRRAAKEHARENAPQPEPETKDVPMDQTALARTSANFQLTVSSFDDAMRVAETLAKSTFVPESYRNDVGAVFAAMVMASELDIGIMQGLQGIAVINGRPSVWGDLALALVMRHRDFDGIIEEFSDERMCAKCTIKRKGRIDIIRYFDTRDAENARLLNKPGPWQTARKRMLQMRARAFAMRDQFPDALRGVSIREEVEDYDIRTAGTVVVHEAPATAQRAEVKAEPQLTAAPPVAAVVAQPVAIDPADFQIKSGKNAGKKLRDLNDSQVEWYAGECKDAQTKAAAATVWERRKLARAIATAQAAVDSANSNGHEHIDADGVVTRVEVMQ